MRSAMRNSGAWESSRIREPSSAWVLTTSNSSSVSRSGLSRIVSGIAILPRSCDGRSDADQLDQRVLEADAATEPGGQGADALGVLPGVVVAVLGRVGEAPQGVGLRVLRPAVAGDGVGRQHRLQITGARTQPVQFELQREAIEHQFVADRARGQAAQVVERDDRRSRARAERVQTTLQLVAETGQREDRVGLRGRRAGDGLVGIDRQLHRRRATLSELRPQARGRRRVGPGHEDPGTLQDRRMGTIVRALLAVCAVCHAGHDAGPSARPSSGGCCRRLPGRVPDRSRRHGRGPPGRASDVASTGCAEDHRPGSRRGLRLPRALSSRGPDRRHAHPSQRGDRLRRRRDRRHAVHRHAVRARRRTCRPSCARSAGWARIACSTSRARSPLRSTPPTVTG